jgi:hypothetical protein
MVNGGAMSPPFSLLKTGLRAEDGKTIPNGRNLLPDHSEAAVWI